MAESIHVSGKATIWVDTGASHALEDLGITQDGVELTFQAYALDVPTDEDGGTDGPPTDVQWLGETAQIRLQLTKWDAAIGDKVAARIRGFNPGAQGTPGTLWITSGRYFRLLVLPVITPINFPCVVFREPIEINKGTKFSRFVLSGTAYRHPTTRTLYDAQTGATTTTGTTTTLAV
jgi:hypothetical protein